MEYSDRFENFWLRYGSSEGLKQKGPKREAYKVWEKVCKDWSKQEGHEAPDEVTFSQHVWRGYDALMKNRKALDKAGKKPHFLPHARTWLYQWRFDDGFEESTGDLRRAVVEQICACGSEDVFGRSEDKGWICRACDLEDWKAGKLHLRMRPTLRALVDEHPKSKQESWKDWSYRVLMTMPVGRKLLERYG